MANLSTKIKLYLTSEGKIAQNEFDAENVILQDVGSGAYISNWNVSGVTKPTAEQLSDLETDADKVEALGEVLSNRQAEYPSIQELVVALYDTDDKSAIETKRASVKAKYPKP